MLCLSCNRDMDRLSALVYRCNFCSCGYMIIDKEIERIPIKELNWFLLLRGEVRNGKINLRS